MILCKKPRYGSSLAISWNIIPMNAVLKPITTLTEEVKSLTNVGIADSGLGTDLRKGNVQNTKETMTPKRTHKLASILSRFLPSLVCHGHE
jgi:hypothetical protein